MKKEYLFLSALVIFILIAASPFIIGTYMTPDEKAAYEDILTEVSAGEDISEVSGAAWRSREKTATKKAQLKIEYLSCSDSDSGKNYDNLGKITVKTKYGEREKTVTITDSCYGNKVIEWYCNGKIPAKTYYTCKYECSNGACKACTPATCSQLGKECGSWDNGCGGTLNCGSCSSGYECQNGICVVTPTPICTDNDGGVDYFVSGTCTDHTDQINGTVSEICYNPTGLRELHCSNGTCVIEYYTCPSGYICSNGACVACTDTCQSLGYECGTHTICGVSTNCGTCSSGYVCKNGACVIPTCTESDGGWVYSTKGTVTTNGETYTDYCLGYENRLREYKCNYDNTLQYTEVICKLGCSDGACICTVKTCSEAGKECGSWTNDCGDTLNCGSCPAGYTCSNGECISGTNSSS